MATTQERLDEAREALHKLMLGEQVVTIVRNGRSTQFRAADVEDLRKYIRELEIILEPTKRRPFGVVW